MAQTHQDLDSPEFYVLTELTRLLFVYFFFLCSSAAKEYIIHCFIVEVFHCPLTFLSFVPTYSKPPSPPPPTSHWTRITFFTLRHPLVFYAYHVCFLCLYLSWHHFPKACPWLTVKSLMCVWAIVSFEGSGAARLTAELLSTCHLLTLQLIWTLTPVCSWLFKVQPVSRRERDSG